MGWQGAARVARMLDESATACLHEELQGAREALVWKLDGLSEYDIRRPLTSTGTNLLGLFEPCGYMGEQLGDYSIGAPDAKGCWALELGGYRPCDARRRPSPESVKTCRGPQPPNSELQYPTCLRCKLSG